MTVEILNWLDDFWEEQYVVKKDHMGYGLYSVVHNSPKAVVDSYMNLCNIIDKDTFYSLRHAMERRLQNND